MKKTILTVIIALFGITMFAQNADALVGTYLKADGKSKIEFFKSGSTYSGKIVWLAEPNDKAGNPKKDVNNDDKSLQSRPLIGLVNITGLKFEGDGKYIGGKAYRPAEGDDVKFEVTINADKNINVRGYKGIFYKTETWKKQ